MTLLEFNSKLEFNFNYKQQQQQRRIIEQKQKTN